MLLLATIFLEPAKLYELSNFLRVTCQKLTLSIRPNPTR